MKISVNVTSVTEDNKAKEKIKKASKAKEIPTMEESWELIYSRKELSYRLGKTPKGGGMV